MSYPAQGRYHDSGEQGQNMRHSYGAERHSVPNNSNNPYATQAPYLPDNRRPQYESSGYEYSRQNQHSYANGLRPQPYSTDAWRIANAQNASSDERRQADDYTTGGAAGSGGQNCHNPNPSTSAERHVHGLNNLVYTSGREDSRVQQHTHPVRHLNVSSTTRYLPTSGSSALDQVQSPVTQGASHHNAHPSMSSPYASEPSSVASRQPATSSAAAFVGAVNHRFPQSSLSPVNAAQAAPTQRSASPYHQSTKAQSHLRASSGTVQASYASSNPSGTMGQHWSQSGNTGHHRYPSSRNFQSRGSELPNQAPAQVNSISNLVSSTMEEVSQAMYSSTVEPQHTVSDYIDPSKLFKPYHLEHERRRRDAEALAKRKTEEEAAAAAKRKEEEEAARRKREEEETAGKRIQKAAAVPKRQGEHPTTTTNTQLLDKASMKTPSTAAHEVDQLPQQTGQSSQDGAKSEADMTAELKALMERMKEFRNKDPTLFQKLLEDMRRPGQGSTVPAVPVHSSSRQMSQQGIPAPQNQSVTTPTPDPTPTAVETTLPLQSSQMTSVRAIPQTQPRPAAVEPPPSHKVHWGTPDESAGRRLNEYRVVVEDNPQGLPDLGHFPAERRIRSSAKKSTAPNDSLPGTVVSLVASTKTDTNNPPTATNPQITMAPASTALIFSNTTSPSLLQGLPPKTSSGSTIWPEEKRNALAEAAVKSLRSLPENGNVAISPADIHLMLDKNPSYIDLCEMLERKGLKFHRGHFARQLLSNVPYLNSPQAKTAQHPPPPPPQSQQPAQIPARAPGLPNMPMGQSSRPPLPISILPQRRPPAIQSQKKTSTPQHTPNRRTSKLNPSGPSRVEPPPGSKEAMARKRDFSELVDLTALSDDEDYVMSRKHARIENPPERDPFEQYQAQVISTAQILPARQDSRPLTYPPFQHGMPLTVPPIQTSATQGLQPQSHLSRFAPVPEHPLSERILAKPINKSDALHKTYYNPKTVARDILLAAGTHPFERPLNAHLAGLLGKHIHLDSDLSTFDWDAVDPGGPQVPHVAFVDVPTEPPRYTSGEQGKWSKQDKQDKQRSQPEKYLPLPDSDKRRLPAPGPVPAPAVIEQREQERKLLQPSTVSNIDLAPFDEDGENAGDVSRQRCTRLTQCSSTPTMRSSIQSGKMSDGAFFPSGKRRGRPPGAKNLAPDSSTGKTKQGIKREISVTVSSRASPNLPVFRCHWKGCKAHLHNLDTLRQHTLKVHRPTEDELEDYGYICWWKKCRYLEVDNDGLVNPKKAFSTSQEWLDHIEEDHLHAVALKYGDGPSTKHIGKQQPTSFDVSRFVYEPQSRRATRTSSYTDPQTVLDDRARYLSDENGRITTPAVSEKSQQDLEPDTMTLLKAGHDDAEGTAQRSFMKTHRQEKNNPKAVAEETLRAMEARKAALGPGIDKGGCVLVNEARRSTLLQSPGIRRVVDADY